MADKSAGDDRLLIELAAGKSFTDAGKATGISVRTIHRRMAEPAFLQRLAELRAAALEQAASRLTDQATKAADRLCALMYSIDDRVALGAARSVLEHSVKLREATDINRRLTELEAQLLHQEER